MIPHGRVFKKIQAQQVVAGNRDNAASSLRSGQSGARLPTLIRYAKKMSIHSQIQDISHAFRTDAGHQLIKARTAFEHAPVRARTGFQAKIVVDLFMAAECALKSMMCSGGTYSSAESALRDILKIGHDLKRLMRAANPSSLTEDDKKALCTLNKKGVSLRYDLDLTSLVTSELLESDSVDFGINEQYVSSLIELVEKMSNEAQQRHRDKYGTQGRVLTKKQVENEVKELRQLLKAVRKKKPKKAEQVETQQPISAALFS
jgi:hypothetical protein